MFALAFSRMHGLFKGAYRNTGKEKCMGYSRAQCFLVFTSEIKILSKSMCVMQYDHCLCRVGCYMLIYLLIFY